MYFCVRVRAYSCARVRDSKVEKEEWIQMYVILSHFVLNNTLHFVIPLSPYIIMCFERFFQFNSNGIDFCFLFCRNIIRYKGRVAKNGETHPLHYRR